MRTMINFVYYGMETALFVLMTFSCSYLCLLFFRSRSTIPIMDLDQKAYFESQNLELDSNAKYLTVNNKHQKGRRENNENGNNSSYSLISSYHYYNDIEHASTTTTTTTASSNASKEGLPFVSVIVPARNEENYIERCLLSLLCQDYPNFEVIAVDDNSSDNTLNTMEDIKNKKNLKAIGLSLDK